MPPAASEVREFELPGDDRGVLLIHGFTGTPWEMGFVADALAARGVTVLGVRLPGHCTTPAELDRTTWADWYAEVERGLDRLRARCRAVAVVGQSLGGLLALHLAARRGADLACVASLATPMWLFPTARAAVALGDRLPALRARLSPAVKRGGTDVADRVTAAANPCYPVIPLVALGQVDALRRVVRAELAAVTRPLLVMHALQDHTAPYGSAAELIARVGSREAQLVTLPRSYHVIAIDLERDRVGREVGDFTLRHLG